MHEIFFPMSNKELVEGSKGKDPCVNHLRLWKENKLFYPCTWTSGALGMAQ